MIVATLLKRIGIASVLLAAGLAWPVWQAARNEPAVLVAAIAGFVLSVGNIVAGTIAIGIGRSRDPKEFNVWVFGSMTVRMLALMGSIWLCVAVLQLPPPSLLASLAVCYVTFLVIEVHYLWSLSRRS